MSSGERDLAKLLAGLEPELHEGEWVFAVVEDDAGLDPIATVREAEGLTAVVSREAAEVAGLDYDFVAAWITLTVHSSLDAVGMTAAFAARLTERGISCNVIAGSFHDHIFVPVERGAEAVAALRSADESR